MFLLPTLQLKLAGDYHLEKSLCVLYPQRNLALLAESRDRFRVGLMSYLRPCSRRRRSALFGVGVPPGVAGL